MLREKLHWSEVAVTPCCMHVSIRDFAIVDQLDLEFRPGFTALTGETGAGKSILIDALSLALGERAGSEDVRAGRERAEVSAEFSTEALPGLREWLRDQALEGDPNRLLLRRVVDSGGRSRAFINGRAATLNQMREVGERLVDIHGQHAHQSLLRSDAQRQVLDSHAGLSSLAAEVAGVFRAGRNCQRRGSNTRQMRPPAIPSASSSPGRWRSLRALRSSRGMGQHPGRARPARARREPDRGVQAAIDSLSESDSAALGVLSGALSRLRPLVDYDRALSEAVGLLESGEVQLREAAYALRHYADRVELDPGAPARGGTAPGGDARYRTQVSRAAGGPCRSPGRVAGPAQGSIEVAGDLETLIGQEQAARASYDKLAARLSAERKKAAAKLARDVSCRDEGAGDASGTFRSRAALAAAGGQRRRQRTSRVSWSRPIPASRRARSPRWPPAANCRASASPSR